MSAEQEIATIQPDENLTVFDVWERILEKHPEITRMTALTYILLPHGQVGQRNPVVLPRERVEWDLDEVNFYGQPNEMKAIGAQIEIRPKDYDPEIDYSGAGRWYNDGDFLEIDPKQERAFIFIDLESPPSKPMLELCLKSLRPWRCDWYLLDTGGSFHLIFDKLVKPAELPKYYGQFIMDMSFQLPPYKAKVFGSIGKYLIDNCDRREKLLTWIGEVRQKFGHFDESLLDTGKLVFPIDLRFLTYCLEGTSINHTVEEGFLRVTKKHGSIPILKALQVDGKVTVFEYKNDPFNRKQLSLPTL